MKLLFKNMVYRYITLSYFFDLLGSCLYNIVFVVYTATFFKSSLMIAVANIIMLVPIVFQFKMGIEADKTRQKGKRMCQFGFVQASLFLIIAYLSTTPSLFVFSIVCCCNIIGDVIADYRSSLSMGLLQKHVEQADLMQAFSFRQLVSQLTLLFGQGLGIWLLTLTNNNFSLVAIINAILYIFSSLTLLAFKEERSENVVSCQEEEIETKKTIVKRLQDSYANMKLIFEGETRFLHLLLAIILVNLLGSALSAVFNISLLERPVTGWTYGQSLLVLQLSLVFGRLLSSLLADDYVGKKSFQVLLFWSSVCLLVIGVSNYLNYPLWVSVLAMFSCGYLIGKINPKLSAALLANISSETLAQTGALLDIVFLCMAPFGTVLFSSLGVVSISLTWFCFSLCSFILLLMSYVLQKGGLG